MKRMSSGSLIGAKSELGAYWVITPVQCDNVRPFVDLTELARRLFVQVSRPLTIAGHHLDAALVPALVHAAGQCAWLLPHHAQANEVKVGLHCLPLVPGNPALRIALVYETE